MTDALRYEWVRLRTLRSTWWLSAIVLAVAILLTLPALTVTGDATIDDYGVIVTGGGIGVELCAVMVGLLGAFAVGHEYRHRTIQATLTTMPRRSVVFAAKALVVLGFVVVLPVVAEVLRYLTGLAILGRRLTTLGVFPGPIGRVWLGVLLYTAIFALIGMSFAGLVRNVPGAIVTLIVVPLIVESAIRGLLSIGALSPVRGLAKVLPFSAGAQVFSYGARTGGGDAPAGFTELPSPYVGLLVFVIFLAIVLGIAWALFDRRDA